jgi:hypothetical protein
MVKNVLSKFEVSYFDESAFAVWDYAALDMDIDIGEDQSADLRSPRSAVSRGASSPSSDDDAPERGSESSSISISSLNTQDGLGSPAMRNIPEETGEEDFSTETAKAQGTALMSRECRDDEMIPGSVANVWIRCKRMEVCSVVTALSSCACVMAPAHEPCFHPILSSGKLRRLDIP